MRAHIDQIERVNPAGQRHRYLRPRASAGGGAGGRRRLARGDGPRTGGGAAVWAARRAQGPGADQGHPHHFRVASVPRLRPRLRRPHRRAAQAAGAITLGKTNTPEFGAGSQTFNPVFGATRNPYDPEQDLRRQQRRRRGGAGLRYGADRRRQRLGRQPAQPGQLLQRRRLPAVGRPRAVLARVQRLVSAIGSRANGADGARPGAATHVRPRDPIRAHPPRSQSPARLSHGRSSATSKACAWRGAATWAGLPVDPRVTAVLRLSATCSRIWA